MSKAIEILKGMFSLRDPIDLYYSRTREFIEELDKLTGAGEVEDYSVPPKKPTSLPEANLPSK